MAIVTDGTRVLGLGDTAALGTSSMRP
ncbi:MAG: hypothetical protein ACE5JE_03205 [Thermoplasmata archaeon]